MNNFDPPHHSHISVLYSTNSSMVATNAILFGPYIPLSIKCWEIWLTNYFYNGWFSYPKICSIYNKLINSLIRYWSNWFPR